MGNWPYNVFITNCTLLVLYVLLALTPFHWPYPAFIGLIGQFPTSPTPRPLSLFLRLGSLLSIPVGYGSSSHHQGPWPNPSYEGGLGLKALFGPFRPPTASIACGPGDSYALFDPIPKRQKRAKGEAQQSQTTSGPT
ncbi:hypothetical protein O181_011143 [Austropuccinia psidii MF-1]|uniref:Uncharacterized protein n=1 Tax=Austropuccinia psidii MF-1 TaxID=1389203 RepID=A0A9Q3GL13_9BASI|nr:hypothetical protein [Austropuccinia psidii MF-1]